MGRNFGHLCYRIDLGLENYLWERMADMGIPIDKVIQGQSFCLRHDQDRRTR